MTLSPDDFEATTNVTARVRSDKSAGVVVSVRLNREDAELLLAMAEESGRSLSEVARQAVRTFLHHGKGSVTSLEISYGAESAPITSVRSERQTFSAPVLQSA